METPLLQTKLYIPPPRPELVRRPRLVERIDAGIHSGHKLTLVSAPAGSGKTTLLSECAAECEPKVRVAWLSLDQDDNDPLRFWTYLIAAVRVAQPDLGRGSMQRLQAPQMPPIQSILIPVLNDFAALSAKVVLVLDDYHVISTPAIHEGLTFLLDHQPPQLHMAISTRADPPLPIARLRARRQITELRAGDLHFTLAEAATYLNETMDLSLEEGDVGALRARTEGWIAGLQLAALSMQGRADRQAFIQAFAGSHHYILEYLTEEVVDHQPESVRRFLIETSTLDRLCGSLCDAVTGENNGSGVLADLSHRNLFVVPLDDEHRWYRYHHLFADLLGNLLRRELSPEGIHELHRRAGEWYAQNGDQEKAIHHILQAQDHGRAASLIEAVAQATIAQGRLTKLLRWVSALPESLLQARPRLRLYYGWALSLSGDIVAAERVLQDTRATLHNQPPSAENKELRGRLAALMTGIAMLREETATVIREAQEALVHLPEEDQLSRARVYVALGTAYAYEDRMEAATQTWQQARDLALEAGNPFLATAAIEMLAGTQVYHQGRLRTGEQGLQQVLDLATTPDGKLLPFSGTSHALLAEIHLEWNDLETAAGYLETGIELQQQGGIAYGLIHTFCTKARLERALGNAEGAVQALQTAEQALKASSLSHMVLHLASCQVRLRLWLGDVETAARWAEGDPATIKRQIPESLPTYLREVQQISRARVHLARGETEQALAWLEGLEEQAQAAGRLAQAIDICLLKALAWQAQGESAAAFGAFGRSLSWAELEGYVRLFLEVGRDVIPLLRRATARRIRPEYADGLLAAFGVQEQESTPTFHREASSRVGCPDSQPLTEPLTPRELDVLYLVCDGLSNREISERLTVTLNTVKKHSSHIYGKLGVSSRAQAIVRARDLGLC